MLLGRTGLSPVLVGRSAALGRLRSLLGGVAAGGAPGPTIALVSGEAGVGKTRLLRELGAGAPIGTVVLAGQAEPGSLGRPLELVRSLLGPHPFDARADLPESTRASVTAIVERIGDRPGLVVFDDLHWADAESVEVFERLAATGPATMLLVGTYRPEDLSRRLPGGEMLGRLERRHTVHPVHLDRLSRDEVASFLAAVAGRPAPSAAVEVLSSRTGGNPFFLEEIMASAGDIPLERLVDEPLPWTLAELVAHQLDGLNADERRVVEALAVIGRRVPFDVLAIVTELGERTLIAHLRSLVAAGVLLEERPDELSFRHALVRDAVQSQLLGRERRRLHERALAALIESTCATDFADLARHAAGAGRYDDLVRLGRSGVAHYLAQGSSFQALRLAVEALAEAPDDVELLAGAARAAWLIGLDEEAAEHAQRWRLVVTGTDDLEGRCAALRQLARIRHEQGRTTELWALTDELESLIDELAVGEERPRVQAFLAQAHMLNDHNDLAIAWALLAEAEALRIGADAVRAQAMVERGSALVMVGEVDGAVLLRDGSALAESAGDLVTATRGLNNLIGSVPLSLDERRAVVARLNELAERSGFTMLGADAMGRTAFLEVHAGQWEAAWNAAQTSARPSQQRGHPGEDWATGIEALLLIEAGRADEVEARLLRPPESVHGRHWYSPHCVDRALRLALLAQRGGADRLDVDLAWRAVEELVAEQSGSELDLVSIEIEAALALGIDPAAVRSALGGLRPVVSGNLGGLLEARLRAADGDAAGAAELLDAWLAAPAVEVVSAATRAGAEALLARTLLGLGDTDRALVVARRGRDRLAAWPGWRRDDLDALIRRLEGARSYAAGDTELTPREREVAALLADGLTNAQVAAALYISPKTAAVHVSNILMKLGMASRAEVAAWAVRSGVARAS